MSNIYPFVADNGLGAPANIGIADTPTAGRGWMKGTAEAVPQSAVSPNQMTSLSAMIAYIAMQSGQSEFRLERSLSDYFGIPNAKCLPASQYDNAIRFLVDVIQS